MKMRLILFFFLIILFISGYADPNVIVVTSAKEFYDIRTPISLNLNVLSTQSLESSVACNIQIIDSNSKTVFEAKYVLNDLTTTVNLFLPDSCKQGKYFCKVYLYSDTKDSYKNISSVAFFYGKVNNNQDNLFEKGMIEVMPESKFALQNFTNKFIVRILSEKSFPLSRNFFVKTVNGLLIAKGKTNENGVALIEIPNQQGEGFEIIAENCVNTQFKDYRNLGFAMHCSGSETVSISINKAEAETYLNPILKVYYDRTLINETLLQFQHDVGIIETEMNLSQFKGRSLLFKLVNQNDSILSSKLYWLSDYYSTAAISLKSFLDDSSQFNSSPYFSLKFKTSIPSGEKVSYQITDSLNAIIDIGEVQVNPAHYILIPRCSFLGKASVVFYLNAKHQDQIIESELMNAPYNAQLNQSPPNSSLSDSSKPYKAIRSNLKDSILSDSTYLPSVVVKSKLKSRKEEMEERYVKNFMFKNFNSTDIIVEDDPLAYTYFNNFNLYILKHIAGVSIDARSKALKYRFGTVEVIVDEVLNKPVPESMEDIAYIKFIRGPFRGLNEGGSFLTSANAGVTAHIVVYTKQNPFQSKKVGNQITIPVVGFSN